MASRLTMQTALGVTLGVLMGASGAFADTSYQPYYEQSSATTYHYPSHGLTAESTPLVANYATAQPQASVTTWQKPQDTAWQQPQTAMRDSRSLPVGIRSGIDGGVQVSYYAYNEPTPDVKNTGTQLSLDVAATYVFSNHLFNAFDFRYSYGRVNYKSASKGNSNDHENSMWEVRDVVGRDFSWGDSVALAPYIGFGFRSLYSDLRGKTDLGANGYQRDSEYLYLPVGIRPQFRIDSGNKIAVNVEYDHLLHGWHTSHLGDETAGEPDVKNGQSTGFGMRADVMWDAGPWSVGPFVNYWNINKSSTKSYNSPAATCGSSSCDSTIQHNITVEGGMQLKFHFVDF